MATLSSILAWRIPWAEEPGGLQSMGPQRDKTGLSDFTSTFKIGLLLFQVVNSILIPILHLLSVD